MPEFLSLVPPEVALKGFLEKLDIQPQREKVPTLESLGRFLVDSVISPESLPSFTRSTVDGYAVRAIDTYSASDTLPVYLEYIGELPMGKTTDYVLKTMQCMGVHTGGAIPNEATAVVMLENTQIINPTMVEVHRPVAQGENLLRIGEDVSIGDEVMHPGKRLRSMDIGGLLSLGITAVNVAKPPLVGIISTGDEIVTPDRQPMPGQVRDINSYSLGSLIDGYGGQPKLFGIIPDNFNSILESARIALENCDILLFTAGSSASARDYTANVINSLGDPGVVYHGLNIKPGKPTILGICDQKAVIGLPGNPVSALVIAYLFLLPVLEKHLGCAATFRNNIKQARLNTNYPSQAGREDWFPVKLSNPSNVAHALPEAIPIFSKSNHIFSLVRADGLVRIPMEMNGYEAGEIVDVFLLG
jgi:molybdopterin molybdotransferase